MPMALGTSGPTMVWPYASTPSRSPQRLEILGAPVLTLELSSDRPNAFLCARLCDVAPDGASLRVTYGLLNLTHRDEPRAPRAARARPALPGALAAERHRARVPARPPHPPGALDHLLADRVALARGGDGHRVHRRQPLVSAGPTPRPRGDAKLRPFREAESAPPEVRTTLRPGGFERTFSYDVARDTMTYTSIADSGLQRIDAIGLELEEIARKVYRIKSDDPLSADNVILWTTRRAPRRLAGARRDPHAHARDPRRIS